MCSFSSTGRTDRPGCGKGSRSQSAYHCGAELGPPLRRLRQMHLSIHQPSNLCSEPHLCSSPVQEFLYRFFNRLVRSQVTFGAQSSAPPGNSIMPMLLRAFCVWRQEFQSNHRPTASPLAIFLTSPPVLGALEGRARYFPPESSFFWFVR